MLRPMWGKPCVLKLDIRHFFDSILYSAVKETAFPAEVYAENLRILLAMLCYGWDRLPQGAPTSPCITNILMRDFDNEVGAWCRERQIAYTRYCDDMTFSGDFARDEVLRCVEPRLRALGFYLNPGKTKWLPADRRQLVTGIVVNKSAMSRPKSAVHCARSCISAENLASPATWREPGSTDRRTATWLSSWAGSTTSCRSRREGGSCRKPGLADQSTAAIRRRAGDISGRKTDIVTWKKREHHVDVPAFSARMLNTQLGSFTLGKGPAE